MFKFNATYLIVAVVIQIFSDMFGSNVSCSYIYTRGGGVQYLLCVSNQAVQAGDEYRFYLTTASQVLAFIP